VRRASTPFIIRLAVVLDLIGLLLLVPILTAVSALGVGLFMLGGLLLTIGIVLYVYAVVRDLRGRDAL
jgi:predicted membrane channel-forming protein YqfA (hemolysin III family)